MTALPFIANASVAKTSTERQLELTLNALARSMRKAIRLAEKGDPTSSGGLWKAVEHRAGLLETMLKAAAEYAKCLMAPQPQPQPPVQPQVETEQAEAAPAVKPAASPAPAPLDQRKPVPASKVNQVAGAACTAVPYEDTESRPLKQGKGWTYAA